MTETSITEKNNANSEIIQPGEILRVARENKSITKKQIGEALNLPERFIEYIELGDFAKLPGHTFARGYIRNYAKFLELPNAEELVCIFDRYTGTNALGSSVNNLQQIKQIKQISNNIYWLISFVVLLIVVGIIFIWWQGRNSSNNTNTIDNAPIVVEPTLSSPSASNQLMQSLPDTSMQGNNIINESEQQTTSNLTSNEKVDTVIDTTSVTPEALPPVTANDQSMPVTATSNPNEGVVQANFSGNCWITIIDATSKVLVSKLMTKGTNLEIKGKPPLEVILGAPNTVTMTYNGQAVTINAKPGATHRFKLGQ